MDHALIKKGIVSDVKYNWEFIKRSEIYPKVKEIEKGKMWNIPKGYPDHAILIFEFTNRG